MALKYRGRAGDIRLLRRQAQNKQTNVNKFCSRCYLGNGPPSQQASYTATRRRGVASAFDFHTFDCFPSDFRRRVKLYLEEGSPCQHASESATSGRGAASSHSGRRPPSHTPAQICASSNSPCAGRQCHMSHTAARAHSFHRQRPCQFIAAVNRVRPRQKCSWRTALWISDHEDNLFIRS